MKSSMAGRFRLLRHLLALIAVSNLSVSTSIIGLPCGWLSIECTCTAWLHFQGGLYGLYRGCTPCVRTDSHFAEREPIAWLFLLPHQPRSVDFSTFEVTIVKISHIFCHKGVDHSNCVVIRNLKNLKVLRLKCLQQRISEFRRQI